MYSSLNLGSRLYRTALYVSATGYLLHGRAAPACLQAVREKATCLQAVPSEEGKELHATCAVRLQHIIIMKGKCTIGEIVGLQLGFA